LLKKNSTFTVEIDVSKDVGPLFLPN